MADPKFEFYGIKESFIPCSYDVFSISESEFLSNYLYPFTVRICKKYTGTGYYFDVEMLIKVKGREEKSFKIGQYTFPTVVNGKGHDWSWGDGAYVMPTIKFFDINGELCEYNAYSDKSDLSRFADVYFESIALISKLKSEDDFNDVWKFKHSDDKDEVLLAKMNLIAAETSDSELKQKIKIIIKEKMK